MKRTSFLILVLSSSMLRGQTTTQPITQTPLAASATRPHPAHVRAVMRPPDSALPPLAARVSTAEAGATRGVNPPLQVLPDFTVNDRNGHDLAASALGAQSVAAIKSPTKRPVSSSSVKSTNPIIQTTGTQGHWLLLYRAQNCIPCDRLMNTLAASTSADFNHGTPYVVVVDTKTVNGLETVRTAFASMSEATWLADTNRNAFAALKPHGAPMLYALDGNRIAWTIPGNLNNSATVTAMTEAWIKGSAKPADSETTTTTAAR